MTAPDFVMVSHWRWTDGCAALPAGIRQIVVDLDGEALYFEEPSIETKVSAFTRRAA